ncbi:MAG: cation transporter [Clostridia bacterium]|nr:cation transporter [Clostridia bacterium]
MLSEQLIRLFIKQPQDTASPKVRYAYGRLASFTGLVCNLLLFVGKLLAGILSGSVAIIADAFNNLSDAGSGIVTLLGFKLASAPPDDDHPFGHGRMEYLSAMGVAVLIILAGFELASSALDKILHPVPAQFSWLTVGILAAAIAVKLWMAVFYRHVGKRIQSDALLAASVDSRNDVICTALVLVTTLLSRFCALSIDGYVGMAVALFIMWSGFLVIRETISPLLGQAPNPELVENIRSTVMEFEGIVGIHDMIIHDYGPGRTIVSLHAEVPADRPIGKSHDIIDNIENRLMEKYNLVSCIHMDPVETDNPEALRLKEMAIGLVTAIDPALSIHDFRVVVGDTHTNLLFDVVTPHGYKDRDGLSTRIKQAVHAADEKLYAVIKIETSFTG